jgi:hypothetical protein
VTLEESTELLTGCDQLMLLLDLYRGSTDPKWVSIDDLQPLKDRGLVMDSTLPPALDPKAHTPYAGNGHVCVGWVFWRLTPRGRMFTETLLASLKAVT